MSLKKIACIAALSTSAIASFTYAGSAHAIGFDYTPGVFRTEGVTDEGAFSKNVNDKNYVTIDFNSKGQDNGLFKGNDLVDYTFSKGSYSTSVNQKTGIISDQWGPSGVNGEDNKSNYLAVFSDSTVSIKAKNGGVFNYFGIDLGALSGGNTFELLKGGKAVTTVFNNTTYDKLTYDVLNEIAQVANKAQGGQKNGFFEFFSQGFQDNFDEIRLSQVGGGGFESDNHTFKIASGAYKPDPKSVPEPTAVVGLMAVGGMFLLKRKSQKSVNLG
ncbi:PEP-CTERM sorting domain-containing protein [Calothrix sp. PCC 7507]|uniref:Npun_F0296 family exosortase-dependent surface protein n=1 Tax=Calothrix sp. PCC 7507 TaxID=99598 RepID=UPI00029ECD9A|nr:PEP-CTERM sorting domain-containing protein [Calothrix sp. PCC 7507]AFY32903.1 PEP motif putative anchor domain protein [Calothrix sp. PCC 7507]